MTATIIPFGYCSHDLDNDFEYSHLLEALTAYVDSVPAIHDGLYVLGQNLGWQHRTGTASVELDADALAQFLTGGMDCNLDGEWNTADHTLTVVRYHHDAPTGETLRFTPTWSCEYTGDLQPPNAVNYAAAMNVVCKYHGKPEDCLKLSWEGLICDIDADPWYNQLRELDNPPLDVALAIVSREPRHA